MNPIDVRSGIAAENIQEVIDAATSVAHAVQGGQQQYQTPQWLARACAQLLPFDGYSGVLDPQCAEGNLIREVRGAQYRYGVDIDKRINDDDTKFDAVRIRRITANCVTTFALFDDLFPETKFECIVANPPFAIRWKLADETTIDSTEWTWKLIEKRLTTNGAGFLISNANTIERMGLHRHPWVYLYQRLPAGGIWENCNVELGIIHYCARAENRGAKEHRWTHVPNEFEISGLRSTLDFTGYYRPWSTSFGAHDWSQLSTIIDEEAKDHPKFNIYLDKEGLLRTYLSTRAKIKVKNDEIMRLMRINRCHPLTLTTERETRKLMHEYLIGGIYTIEPAAKVAISAALSEVASLACPLRPVTELEVVAYADEEEHLTCRSVDPRGKIHLTPGRQYEVRTGTYEFTEYYSRIKPHYDEETGKTTIREHDCHLSGVDRYIEITDDRRLIHRFMDRPDKSTHYHHPETMLWDLFERPYVPTVAEVQIDDYNKNLQAMAFNEMIAGFKYFPGQLDYYARMACKDYGLVAADVGTGKSLGALTLINLKSPKRALLIAPQGTMRSVGEEDEIDYQASQWVTEIQRFAPGEPVFQLFSVDDWQNILRANGGELPPGIYITYPQAYFTNGSFEALPPSWDNIEEKRFCERFNLKFDEKRGLDACYHRNVGASNKHGIKCIAEPSLNTRIAAVHGDPWEMVIIDEAHLCCNLNAQITQNLIRLQPKYRFALTATPIPNIITNIFSLLGWLCVPNWYKGNVRNAAWPYAVDECGRFTSTFLSEETDLTAQEQARKAGKKGWRRVGVRPSPIISSPARLLKLLKPTLAYISKEDCNPNVVGCEVIDVRVALGKEQEKLYSFWLNRGNYYPEFKNPLTIAQVQSTRLRGICASPASLDYTRGMCKSNFNPKTVTILQLIRDCLGKGEQVVVVSARVDQSDALADKLSEAGVPISRIDSSISADLHTAEANRFKKGDSRVMLMGIKCAQGHSFDQCPNLIIASLEWSYGTLHQAKGRVWRLTSPRAVKIWCVLHKNTIEELLFDRVAVKQDAATLCLHGKRVPRDFKTMDASEVLAEHIVNYSAKDGEVLSESECETQWHVLKQQLVMANRPVQRAA